MHWNVFILGLLSFQIAEKRFSPKRVQKYPVLRVNITEKLLNTSKTPIIIRVPLAKVTKQNLIKIANVDVNSATGSRGNRFFIIVVEADTSQTSKALKFLHSLAK